MKPRARRTAQHLSRKGNSLTIHQGNSNEPYDTSRQFERARLRTLLHKQKSPITAWHIVYIEKIVQHYPKNINAFDYIFDYRYRILKIFISPLCRRTFHVKNAVAVFYILMR